MSYIWVVFRGKKKQLGKIELVCQIVQLKQSGVVREVGWGCRVWGFVRGQRGCQYCRFCSQDEGIGRQGVRKEFRKFAEFSFFSLVRELVLLDLGVDSSVFGFFVGFQVFCQVFLYLIVYFCFGILIELLLIFFWRLRS